MHVVRTLRTGTVTGVIVWKLAALALLPAAFCCQAVLNAEDGSRACCAGKDHGDFCPLSESSRSGPADGPRLQACESFDDALLGLLGLTGFTPESSDLQPGLAASGRSVPVADSALSFDRTPPSPPPRAGAAAT